MFDRLLILDTGGYLIYNGDPVDSIIYFKSRVHHANWNESECHTCGNVNPEQIFNIVEASVIDEYRKADGYEKDLTRWNGASITKTEHIEEEVPEAGKEDLPEITFSIPGKFKQFMVFVTRDHAEESQ